MLLSDVTTQTDISLQSLVNFKETINRVSDDEIDNSQVEDDKMSQDEKDPIQRRLHPTCKEDIQLLFSELKIWRKQKLDEIEQKNDISSEARIELRSDVLSKETFLLRKISEIHHSLNLSEEKKKIDEILSQVTSPMKWEISTGEKILVQTQDMKDSSDLIQIYRLLNHHDENKNVSQRIKLIDYAKEAFMHKSSSSSTKEICNLLDREKEFLRRGINTSLDGLRARISHGILHYLEMNVSSLHNLSIKSRCDKVI